MSKMLSWSGFLLVGALLAVVPRARAQEEGERPFTPDEELARLADEVPGFGGLYRDPDGTTHVYLQDLSRAREVEGLGERVEVHRGDYDFRDLVTWKEEMRSRLAQPGAVFLDIDERRNRIVFGVERKSIDAFRSELGAHLRGTRVPPAAVVVEAAEPIVPMELLTDKIRPVPGGVLITRLLSGGAVKVGTLGVNAFRAGVKGFVTTTHFTETWGQVEGSLAFQNVPALNTLIGSEIVDPAFFIGGSCPVGRKCRYSDSAFFDYVGNPSAGGKIANPLFCAPVDGTTTVDSDSPRLPLTSFTFGNPAVGSFLYKVGSTTGCTVGPVHSTCIDANAAGSDKTFLCQNSVLAGMHDGDSGSPVFRDHGDEATLYGIAWGSSGPLYLYSPWFYVHLELAVTPELD